MIKILIFLLMSASSLLAHETVINNQKYSIEYDKDGLYGNPMLIFKGDFVKGLAKSFIRAYARHPDVTMVSMSSPGGLLTEAYEVGKILSNYKAHVWVPRNATCISACALAFMGGETYKISGIIAFHAPYMPVYKGSVSMDKIYSEGQMTGSYQSYYFAANGFRAQLYMMIAQYTNKSTFVYFMNSHDFYYFLMHPERTYKEYLVQNAVPKSVVQGGDQLMKAIQQRKMYEVLRNNSEINVFTSGKVLRYKEMQKKFKDEVIKSK
jgi:hypothetical protein